MDTDNFGLQHKILKTLLEIKKLKKDPEEIKKQKEEIAKTFQNEGIWKKAHYPNGNSIAAHFFQKAVEVLAEIGNKDEEINRLKVSIHELTKEYVKEMKRTEIKVPLDEDHIQQIEEFIKEVSKLSPIDAILALFKYGDVFPSYSEIKESILDIAKESPLHLLISKSIIRKGLKVKQIEDNDEKIEYEIIKLAMQTIFNSTPIHNRIFSSIKKDKLLFTKDFDYLLSLPKYLSEERKCFIRAGISNYLEDRHLEAIHILTLQIEPLMLEIFEYLKIPIYSIKDKEMQTRMFGDAVSNLEKIPGVNPDFTFFLRCFYCDKLGLNLRNELAHGQVEFKNFNAAMSEWLILTFAMFCLYEFGTSEEPVEK